MKEGLKIFLLMAAIVGIGCFLVFNHQSDRERILEAEAAYAAAHREPVKPEFEIQNVVITFYMYETFEDLREEMDWDNLLGMSDCEWKEDANIAYCDIFVVRPKFVDDEEACTIGHEVMHAIYGLYHTDEYGYKYGSGCK